MEWANNASMVNNNSLTMTAEMFGRLKITKMNEKKIKQQILCLFYLFSCSSLFVALVLTV